MTTAHPESDFRPSTPTVPTTLEQLMQQKAALQQQIQTQKATLARLGNELTVPFAPAAHKGNSLLRAFNRGMAVFDGLMLGVRVMRKFKTFFGSKSKYRY